MKLKLKTILMSAKAEVLLQSKYCLNKNSVEPLTTATAAKSYVLSTFACVTAVPLRRCLSTSAESFFIIIKCHLLVVDRLSWISSCPESFLTRRFSKLVIKEGLWITSLNILPRQKVAVKHSCSAGDQIPWRLVFNSFPFSSFHTSDRGNRPFFSGERYLKTCFLVRV